jgi:predicted Zn-dependent peptidase
MKVLREELVEEEELQLVRNYMLGVILGDIDGPFQTMSRWKNYILNDLDASFFYKTIETIKTISAAELRELANLYLHPEKFYEAVVI